MNILIILGVGIIGLIFFAIRQSPKIAANDANYLESDYMTNLPGNTPFEELFRIAASREGLEWELLSAHAFVESSYNPKAHNAEGSSGLMQILLPVSRNKGASQHIADGNLSEWENINTARIFDPEYNIALGAALIRENCSQYGLPRAIAVYNNFHDTGSSQNGPFISQGYVNKVLRKYNELRGE